MTPTIDRVLDLAAERFKRDRGALVPDADLFEALGINSFQAVELMSDLELEFDVEIPDYELQGVKTFSALARKIDERR